MQHFCFSIFANRIVLLKIYTAIWRHQSTWDVSESWFRSCRNNLSEGDECISNARFCIYQKLNTSFAFLIYTILPVVLGSTQDQLWIFQISYCIISGITSVSPYKMWCIILHILIYSFFFQARSMLKTRKYTFIFHLICFPTIDLLYHEVPGQHIGTPNKNSPSICFILFVLSGMPLGNQILCRFPRNIEKDTGPLSSLCVMKDRLNQIIHSCNFQMIIESIWDKWPRNIATRTRFEYSNIKKNQDTMTGIDISDVILCINS